MVIFLVGTLEKFEESLRLMEHTLPQFFSGVLGLFKDRGNKLRLNFCCMNKFHLIITILLFALSNACHIGVKLWQHPLHQNHFIQLNNFLMSFKQLNYIVTFLT